METVCFNFAASGAKSRYDGGVTSGVKGIEKGGIKVRTYLTEYLLQVNQSILYGCPSQTGDIMNIQFVHQIRPVLLNGSEADMQQIGDVVVGVTFGDQFEDFALAERQFSQWCRFPAAGYTISRKI